MALFNGSIGQRNHFAELQELIDAFRQNYLDTARIYFDPNPPYQAHAFPPSEFPRPPIISIVLGEICYNLRSALDYLIYELAAYDAKAPQDGTQFLICDTPQIFARDKASKLKGLSSEHVAGIEQLQPYNGCHWIKVLQTISNPDKHRSLTPRGSVFNVEIVSGDKPLALVPNARAIRYATRPDGIEVQMELVGAIDVIVPVSIHPTLGQVGDSVEIAAHRLGSEVRSLLEAIKPEFK
jgi:hypothetical protein